MSAPNPSAGEPYTATWRLDAACRGMDTALFFTGRGESSKEAKAVCAGCPVRAACTEQAMDQPERFGVWGGKSEAERRRMRHARRDEAA